METAKESIHGVKIFERARHRWDTVLIPWLVEVEEVKEEHCELFDDIVDGINFGTPTDDITTQRISTDPQWSNVLFVVDQSTERRSQIVELLLKSDRLPWLLRFRKGKQKSIETIDWSNSHGWDGWIETGSDDDGIIDQSGKILYSNNNKSFIVLRIENYVVEKMNSWFAFSDEILYSQIG